MKIVKNNTKYTYFIGPENKEIILEETLLEKDFVVNVD